MKLIDSKTDQNFPPTFRIPCALFVTIITLLSLYELVSLVIGIEQTKVGHMSLIGARNMAISQHVQPKILKPLLRPQKEPMDLCENGTRHLINQIRHQQTLATSNWTFTYPILWDRWHVMADYFGPLVNDLKHHFRPFTYLADAEFKHWLEMKDRKSPCNMITIGVGEVWDGEMLVRKKYPQCSLLGVDPGASVNKKLVEAMPNSRFVHAAVSDRQNNLTIYGKDKGEYAYQKGEVVNFVKLLKRENEGKLVDFMSLDAEGAEFALLPLLHRKRDKLPKICQFNVELHFKDENYGHKLKTFMEVLRGFMAEAHFVLMDIDVFDYLPSNIMMRRMFFVNVVDEECVTKFLC